MPDSTIRINVALETEQATARLRDLRSQLNSTSSEINRSSELMAEAVRRRGEYAGGRGEERRQVSLRENQEQLQREVAEAGRQLAEMRVNVHLIPQFDTFQEVITQQLHDSRVSAYSSTVGAPQPEDEQIRTKASMNEVFSEENLKAQRLVSPAYRAVQAEEEAQRQEAAQKKVTAAVEAEAQKQAAALERAAEKEAQAAERAAQRQSEAQEKATIRQQTATDRQAQAAEKSRKQQETEVANATIRAAAARDQAEHQIYQSAQKDNEAFDEKERQQQRIYTQALRDNREFDQVRHRGYYSIQDPEEIRQNDINQQDVLRRMPSRREAQAFYGEIGAAESLASGSGFSKFFGQLNRQGALEAQAAVVNTVQALASGMNPAHVLMMESTQLGGAAIQGNLISLGTIFSALASTTGLVVTGLAALAGAATLVAASWTRAENQIARGQNVAALQGRNSAAVGQEIREGADRIRTSGGLGRVESREASLAIRTAPNLAPETRMSLERSYEAVSRQMFGGDTEQTNKFIQSFGDPGKLKEFTDQLGLIKEGNREAFDTAASIGDGFTTSAMAAKALEDRVRPAIDQLKQAREQEGPLRRTFDIFGTRFETILNQNTGTTSVFNPLAGFREPIFKAGTPALPVEERQANRAAEDRLKVEGDINGLIRQREMLLRGLGGATSDSQSNRYFRAIEETELSIRKTRTPLEQEERSVQTSQLQVRTTQADQAAQHDISQANKVAEAAKATLDDIVAHEQSAAAMRLGLTAKLTAERVKAEQDYRNAVLQTQRLQLEEGLSRRTLTAADRPADISLQRQVSEAKLEDVVRSPASTQQQKDAELLNAIRLRQQETLEAENVNVIDIQKNAALAEAKGDLEAITRLRQQESAIIQGGAQAGLRGRVEAAQDELKTVQTRISTEQRGVAQQIAGIALIRAARPQDTELQISAVRQEQAVQASVPSTSKEAELAKERELITLARQRRLELEDLNVISITQNGILAEAVGNLQEILRTQREINAVIQNSPDRSDIEKANAATQLRQREVGVGQRALAREGQVSGIERAQNPVDLTYQRRSLEEDLVRLNQSGLATDEQKLSKIQEIVQARRAERMEVEDVQIGVGRQAEAILQARENLAGVVNLRRQEAALIEASPDRSPVDKIQARTQLIQTQLQTLQRARQIEIQTADAANQADQRRLQTAVAYANLQLAGNNVSTEDAIRAEQDLTSQVTTGQANRLNALLNTGNLTVSERARVNEQLSALYEQDAQKQIELQTRLTQNIKEENARRVENFKNFFSSVESSAGDLLIAGLNKTQTRQEAVKNFAQSVVSSFVKETENFASKAAGKGLASLINVKLGEGEDSTISNVLAKGLGSAIGLTKNEPKLDQAAVAQRMQQASDAQKTAGDLMLQAAREMKEAVGKISPLSPNSPEALRTPGSSATSELNAPVGGRAVANLNSGDRDVGGRITSTLRDRGWSDAAIQGALNNSITESSLNPNAVGAAKERGLYQFHPKSHIQPFEQAYGKDWSVESQTNYMADVVERSMPGYKTNTDSRTATSQFLKGFEKPADQSETQVAARFANDSASRSIVSKAQGSVTPLNEPVKLPASVAYAPEMEDYAKPKPSAEFSPVAVGDSIAAHLIRKAGVEGQEDRSAIRSYRPGDTAVSGYTPTEVEGLIKKIPQEQIQGRNVILSSGASNNPEETGTVADQIKLLQDKQAQSVTLLGVGTRPDLKGVNERLGEIAKDSGVGFTGPMKDVASDQIHSSNNQALFAQAADTWKAGGSQNQSQEPLRGYSGIHQPFLTGYTKDSYPQPPLKVDQASVSSAVAQGQRAVVADFRTSVQEGTASGQQQSAPQVQASVQQGIVQGQQTSVQTTQQDTTQTQNNVQATNSNVTAVRELTVALQQKAVPAGNGAPGVSLTGLNSSALADKPLAPAAGTDSASGSGLTIGRGLTTMSQGLGLASSAALLFGNNLSTSGRMVLGGVSLLANGFSFLQSVTTLLQGANTLNTVATTANTVATTANSTAQSAGAAGGAVGAVAKAAPFIAAAALEGGGIISAAEGAIVAPIVSAKDGTLIESAAGGLQVQHASLSTSIRTGLRSMAAEGQTDGFRNSRLIPSRRDNLSVNDGKGGRLIVAHPGELVVPAAESSVILARISAGSVASAADGMVVPGASRTILMPSRMSSGIQNVITSGQSFQTSNFSSPTNTNAPTFNYSSNVTGYHPYRSRSDFQAMLRSNGGELMRFVETAVRNGWNPTRSI